MILNNIGVVHCGGYTPKNEGEAQMTKFNWFVFCFGLLVLFSHITKAQWVQTNGPYGGNVLTVAVNHTTLFAGTDRGLFRSIDTGRSWIATYHKPLSYDINFLTDSDSVLFATCNGFLLRSTDNGLNWIQVSNHLGYRENRRRYFCRNRLWSFSIKR